MFQPEKIYHQMLKPQNFVILKLRLEIRKLMWEDKLNKYQKTAKFHFIIIIFYSFYVFTYNNFGHKFDTNILYLIIFFLSFPLKIKQYHSQEIKVKKVTHILNMIHHDDGIIL